MTSALSDLLAPLLDTPAPEGAGVSDPPAGEPVPPETSAPEVAGAARRASRAEVARSVAAARGEELAEAVGTLRASPESPAPASPPPSWEPVARPNGQPYHPRAVTGGRSDVEVLRAARAAGLHVLLDGPPGGGKSALVEAAFGDELLTVAGHQDLVVDNLMGSWIPDGDGGFTWLEGPLPTAMRAGHVLFVDDGSLVHANVLSRLYPAMDGRNTITVDDHEREQVTAAEGFLVVVAHNPGVPGAILSEALESRFTLKVHVATDYDLALRLGVDERLVRIARTLDRSAREEGAGWVPQMRDLLAFRDVAERLGEDVAVANFVGGIPEFARPVVLRDVHTLFPGAAPLALGVAG